LENNRAIGQGLSPAAGEGVDRHWHGFEIAAAIIAVRRAFAACRPNNGECGPNADGRVRARLDGLSSTKLVPNQRIDLRGAKHGGERRGVCPDDDGDRRRFAGLNTRADIPSAHAMR